LLESDLGYASKAELIDSNKGREDCFCGFVCLISVNGSSNFATSFNIEGSVSLPL